MITTRRAEHKTTKDVLKLADDTQAKRDAVREDIEVMFARRAASRYLWHDKWGRDGYAYSK